MTELLMKLSGHEAKAHAKPGIGYHLLVACLFSVSLVTACARHIAGNRSENTIWQEARQTAHAIAGYAYKY